MMRVLALIPARGGSKGLPGKNILPLGGRPLIEWTIAAALGAALIDRVVVSTDSPEIAAVAERAGAEVPFLRPAELAGDDVPALPMVMHALEELKSSGYAPDALALLQPTTPFRTAAHIDEAVRALSEQGADSAVSVCEVKHTMGPHSVMTLEDGHLKPFLEYDENKNIRQCKPVVFHRNGGIYLVKIDRLVSERSLYGTRIAPVFMSPQDSVDIDDAFDLFLAEQVLKYKERVHG